ncbi:MAG TPA: methyltransferase type 11 [candidate division Zixibacteria bacterium]|jgi:ubiquinone/menaquinone biosynthesis C-methylase UbiE|nr:methyltransferase type 11 [candidate division Zixibacteria bacterium]HBZ01334.1 methyltransferase type 11 [candidate division Zixibacteria bacterium]
MAECVCPWWLGYLLANPIRKLYQNPNKILAPHIKPGMTVLEIGPGMGFFSLPMARMVGPDGKIVCLDIQEKMLSSLTRRARRARLENRILTRLASTDSLNIDEFAGNIDFVLAFAVVHEIPGQENLFMQIYQSMKKGATLLIAEPTGHVTDESFKKMLEITERLGFEKVSTPTVRGSISTVLKK